MILYLPPGGHLGENFGRAGFGVLCGHFSTMWPSQPCDRFSNNWALKFCMVTGHNLTGLGHENSHWNILGDAFRVPGHLFLMDIMETSIESWYNCLDTIFWANLLLTRQNHRTSPLPPPSQASSIRFYPENTGYVCLYIYYRFAFVIPLRNSKEWKVLFCLLAATTLHWEYASRMSHTHTYTHAHTCSHTRMHAHTHATLSL